MEVATALLSPALAIVGAITKKSPKPKVVVPTPQITPRANSVATDAIARRRGSAANMTTGMGGAESTTTGKNTLLGQ